MTTGLPTNGTTEQILARSLTNQALASRLDLFRHNRRHFDKVQADAYLDEASRRLRWADAYQNHLG